LMQHPKGSPSADGADSVAARHRGFTLALQYAACVASHSYHHPRMSEMTRHAVAIRKHALAGDIEKTRAEVGATLALDRSTSAPTDTWVRLTTR
jgi:hypothetical protein